MMQKILFTLLCTTLCHTAFANTTENLTAAPEQAKYKISETDVKILIRQLNNIEQCIFPGLAKSDYQKIYDNWSVSENMTMFYFQQNLLKDLIGEQNTQLIEKDKGSRHYFEQMHEKYNHQKANVDKSRCEDFKPIYAQIKQRIESSIPQIYK
ncbi:DUF5358 family protein [Actinobacillus genomosp. 2]|uniref:DUF5358 family protein n=1 Tax=Actinobacillus genomosp. 2 TaxID=230709 RepID=UPI002441D6EA|nr:DUF5358 family protein [Actinobacillus genomosp. 2]WGE32885.1 DUF5358 family protein [Actinobacillus genomosp. 2]